MKLSYWKRYDLVFKHFSPKRIYSKILGFAKKLQLTGRYLEKLLGHTKVHIPDSTKLSTDRYKEIIYRGKPRKVKETFKLHTMVQRHPKRQMTIIMDGLASDGHISDAGFMLPVQEEK